MTTTTRRAFLQGAPALIRGKRPPNILFLFSDEHNIRVAGYNGNRLARTPNLDRLAESGVVFSNAYCNSPLCVPSRLSLTTGKYVHRINAWSNNCRLPSDDYPGTLPRVMNAAGYESYLAGKMHYDRNHGYGFNVVMRGAHNNGLMTGRGGRRNADDQTVNRKAAAQRFQDFHTGDRSEVLDGDRDVTRAVVDLLERRSTSDKPFFLLAGYLAPHFPLIVPEPLYRNYEGKVGLPQIPPGHLDALPLNYKHQRRGFGTVDVPDDITRRGRELYHGLTEWVDAEIGKVLDALRRSAAAENTVIVYSADHGENMGEHGMWWKNCMYEHAAHVPLIVNWPERWKGGQRRNGVCSLVDVVRTIAELGGARVPGDWNGDSLVPLLENRNAPWKERAVSQYYAHNIASGFAMLREPRYKYVYHCRPDDQNPPERELYDLAKDPGEFHSLHADPSQRARMLRMHDLLVKELGEDPDETERRARFELARGYAAP
ncbi:MAG: sulfatase-like hydrolase/transferase [Candidatus Solibacter usitatus]|nr:sulfatase-like hydrolase/transferase [Candidatus Solibacter usitatus]